MNKEEILDILEDGKSLTKDKRRAFEKEDVSQLVEDVLLGAHSLRDEHLTSDDVEARLDAFHQRHPRKIEQEKAKKPLFRSLWMKALAGVAAASAIVAIFYPFGKAGNTVLNVSDEGFVASATHHQSDGKLISTESDAITHEKQITSKDIETYFSKTDTVLLNVDRGQQCKVVLPDGSTVFLHPDSKLVYPKEFDSYERRVKVIGEAYFKVHKAPEHPFIVETKNSETLVTGTEFDVNTFDEKMVKVTLVNGSVQFANTKSKQKVMLRPGQQVQLCNDNLNVCEADTMQYVAWRDGYLFFDNSSLHDILQQISSSFNVPIVCHDSRLLDKRMHFVMRRDKDIQYAIDILNKMKKMKVSLENGKLHIYPY